MDNPKFIHCCIAKDEEHDIGMMLDSVLPYVSESYVLVDDRTVDNTEKIARDKGCNVKTAKFENFAHFFNTLLKWAKGKSDWIFILSPDEAIDSDVGEAIMEMIPKIHNTKIDMVLFKRGHWADLEKKTKGTGFAWPDWQKRLFRNDYPKFYYNKIIHCDIFGPVREYKQVELVIDHYNAYWKWVDKKGKERLDFVNNQRTELRVLSEKQKMKILA